MNEENRRLLLVGDNPFHGISHLSQERARSRNIADSDLDKANVVMAAVANGADGFMFSVSEVTLSILKIIRRQGKMDHVRLYAIVPYAFEYVRIATQTGTPGLARGFAKQILLSGDVKSALRGLGAVLTMNPDSLLKTYLTFEISRIRRAAGKKAKLDSVLLHEVVTDMGLALDFDWLFKSYISFMSRKKITAGFNSRNLPFLVKKFTEWNIDLDQILVASPMNKAGFEMNPSREEFEKTLSQLSSQIVLAISVLAAGYYKPPEALDYIAGFKKLRGVVAGASSEQQAKELFALFKRGLS